jgi:hypothetical protein
VQQVLSDLPALRRYSLPAAADDSAAEVGVWSGVQRRPDGSGFVLWGLSGVVELSDFDPATACRRATPDQLRAAEAVLDEPSACTRVHALSG